LLSGVFRFQYTENTGAFLGLGARLPEPVRFWLLIVLVGGVLIGMLRFVWTSQEINSMGVLGGALVVGGGIGNLIDRIFNAGAVIDFMDMGVGNLRTGIVNVADVAITVGVGILLVSTLFFDQSEEENDRARVMERVRYQLCSATDEDYDFFYRLQVAAMKEYVAQTYGWDDAVQERYLRRKFDQREHQIIVVEGRDIGVLESTRWKMK